MQMMKQAWKRLRRETPCCFCGLASHQTGWCPTFPTRQAEGDGGTPPVLQKNNTEPKRLHKEVHRKCTVVEDGKILHAGVVVGETTTHLRVFDPHLDAKTDHIGSAEWFPKQSRHIHCEVV